MKYDFNELIEKLRKTFNYTIKQSNTISFDQLDPYIKDLFTITNEQLIYAINHRNWKKLDKRLKEDLTDKELEEMINAISNMDNFSELDDNVKFAKGVKYIKQDQLKKKINKTSGVCLLVSLYNAYPWIFLDLKELIYLINILDQKEYPNPEFIKELINLRLSKTDSRKILERSKFNRFKDGALLEITKSIDKGTAIPMGYSCLSKGHNVTIIGYGTNYLYYFDNAEKNQNLLMLDIIEVFTRALYFNYLKSNKKRYKHYELYKRFDDYINQKYASEQDFYQDVTFVLKDKLSIQSRFMNISYSWINQLHNIDLLSLNDCIVSDIPESRY